VAAHRSYRAPDGRTLTYRELGTGRPVVLLHGFTANGATWFDAGPAHALAGRGHRVIVPDLRGHGTSAAPHDPAAYPPDVLTDDLLALREHLALDAGPGGHDLVGYSLGGRVVLRALVRGARPTRAVVAGQGLRAVTGPLDQRGLFRGTLDALLAGTPPALDSPEGATAAWIRRSRNDPRALRHVLDATQDPVTSAELAAVPTPVLVLTGADDEHQAPTAPALAEALPGGRQAEVPGDHLTAMGTPEFHTAVLEFLAHEPDAPSAGP
jgi:pimeloyl-ACP methyl ester carboxylesterase